MGKPEQSVLSTSYNNPPSDASANELAPSMDGSELSDISGSHVVSGDYSESKKTDPVVGARNLVDDYIRRNKKAVECWQDPLKNYTGPVIRIYAEDCLTSLESYVLGCTDDRELSRIKALVASIMERGTRRKLRLISDDWKTRLKQLEDEHPNFSEVIDYLRGGFALAAATDKVLNIDPMLFNGGPGVGKSMFASRFAQMIGTEITAIRMETAQSNSTLVGAEAFWSNAKHGKVFESLVFGENGNPVFYLDELDKINADKYDPASALYALLEPETARKFSDLCYPFLELDASRVIWVATCNDSAGVHAALRSRFKIFDIEALNESQSLIVLQNIIAKTIKKFSSINPAIVFSDDAIHKLRVFSPRKMQQLVREAIGKAVFHGRHIVCASDISGEKAIGRAIGFCQA